MPEIFEKAAKPIQIHANEVAGVHVELYNADDAADPPGHMRALVKVTAKDEDGREHPILEDVPLHEVFTAEEQVVIDGFANRLIELAFSQHGFEKKTVPDDSGEV